MIERISEADVSCGLLVEFRGSFTECDCEKTVQLVLQTDLTFCNKIYIDTNNIIGMHRLDRIMLFQIQHQLLQSECIYSLFKLHI